MKLYSISEMTEVKDAVNGWRIKQGRTINISTDYREDEGRLYYWMLTATGQHEGHVALRDIVEVLQFMTGVLSYDSQYITIDSFTYTYSEYFEAITDADKVYFIAAAIRLNKINKSLIRTKLN